MPYKYYKVGKKTWRIWLANLSGTSNGIDEVIDNFSERWIDDNLLILSGTISKRVFVTVLTAKAKLEYIYDGDEAQYYLYELGGEFILDERLVPEIVKKEVAVQAL